jgi:hypothetical protein
MISFIIIKQSIISYTQTKKSVILSFPFITTEVDGKISLEVFGGSAGPLCFPASDFSCNSRRNRRDCVGKPNFPFTPCIHPPPPTKYSTLPLPSSLNQPAISIKASAAN